ncbi:MAG: aminopeptidase P N-terminal domain-containing protein [Planctomycetota bacterium]|jgi:Xaa-Pro aminopeptidase
MDFLTARRDRIAKAWALSDEVVLIPAGDPISIPGTDQHYPFRAHPEHRYLADMNEPGRVLAYDARDGSWTLFAPRVPVEQIIWYGNVEEIGTPVAEMEAWLAGRTVRSIGAGEGDEELSRVLTAARRIKDSEEIARMRRAAAATVGGFAAAFAAAKPGMTEFQLEAELEVGFLRGGGAFPAFDSIVAAGSSAAVLHYEPSGRKIGAGEFVLIDAGAAADGYMCDCTRTFVVGGSASDDQTRVHSIVLEAQRVAVDMCRPGTEYRDVHLAATRVIAEGLADMGVLLGDADGCVENGAVSVFFPHGVGHLIGLGTHDPGGYAGGRTKSDAPGLRYLRADLPLEAGMVVTIEPGIYFIEAAIADPARREEFGSSVNWERAESLIPLGGVRIEDTVHVTDGDPEILTNAISKSL